MRCAGSRLPPTAAHLQVHPVIPLGAWPLFVREATRLADDIQRAFLPAVTERPAGSAGGGPVRSGRSSSTATPLAPGPAATAEALRRSGSSLTPRRRRRQVGSSPLRGPAGDALAATVASLPRPPRVVAAIEAEALRRGRVVGQLDRKFIVLLHGAQLHLLDQHAADERVRLERSLARLRDRLPLSPPAEGASGVAAAGAGGAASGIMSRRQPLSPLVSVLVLDPPERVHLSPAEASALAHCRTRLAAWGYSLRVPHTSALEELLAEAQGGPGNSKTEPLLLSAPCLFGRPLTGPLFHGMLHDLSQLASAKRIPTTALALLQSRACRTAIRFGDHLSHETCTELVRSLAECQFPFQCAHGRPSVVPLCRVDV